MRIQYIFCSNIFDQITIDIKLERRGQFKYYRRNFSTNKQLKNITYLKDIDVGYDYEEIIMDINYNK